MSGQAKSRRTGLTAERRRQIEQETLATAEEQLLRAELQLSQAEAVQPYLREDEDSTLEECQRDVTAWAARVKALRGFKAADTEGKVQ